MIMVAVKLVGKWLLLISFRTGSPEPFRLSCVSDMRQGNTLARCHWDQQRLCPLDRPEETSDALASESCSSPRAKRPLVQVRQVCLADGKADRKKGFAHHVIAFVPSLLRSFHDAPQDRGGIGLFVRGTSPCCQSWETSNFLHPPPSTGRPPPRSKLLPWRMLSQAPRWSCRGCRQGFK